MSNLVSYINIHDEQTGAVSIPLPGASLRHSNTAETKGAENVHRVFVVAHIVCNRMSPSLGTTCREGAFGRVAGESMQSLNYSANRQLEFLLE